MKGRGGVSERSGSERSSAPGPGRRQLSAAPRPALPCSPSHPHGSSRRAAGHCADSQPAHPRCARSRCEGCRARRPCSAAAQSGRCGPWPAGCSACCLSCRCSRQAMRRGGTERCVRGVSCCREAAGGRARLERQSRAAGAARGGERRCCSAVKTGRPASPGHIRCNDGGALLRVRLQRLKNRLLDQRPVRAVGPRHGRRQHLQQGGGGVGVGVGRDDEPGGAQSGLERRGGGAEQRRRARQSGQDRVGRSRARTPSR